MRCAVLLDLAAVLKVLVLTSGLLCVQGFFYPAGQSTRHTHTWNKRPWHTPSPSSISSPFFLPHTISCQNTMLGGRRSGNDNHHHQQQTLQHFRDKDKAGPLKALRQAAALLNSVLQLVFSSGDVFGTYSSLPSDTPTPDLGRRRGGASRSGGGGPRWGRGRIDGQGEENGGDDDKAEGYMGAEGGGEETEAGIERLSDMVSQRDLNSWEAWQGGSPRKQQVAEEQRAQRKQRRRKKMTFSTRYSCAVSVANASRLDEYMALPFDQYSLLDQSFISRVEGKENEQGNVFRFMVPANELVGLQTVPIVDLRVDVDARKRQLSITSISSRFVARASDGTILGTQSMSLLTNNSLAFSTRIIWDSKVARQGGKLGSVPYAGTPSATGAAADEWARDVPAEGGGNGPGANLARLRWRIFRRGGNAIKAAEMELPLNDKLTAGSDSPPELVNLDVASQRLRKLSCRANLEVGVVVPPPFSLLPGLILRQGASLILSTLVGTLVNRFLELLIEDYHKWQDQASREAIAGALLGYDPERFDEREIEVSEADEDKDDPPPPPCMDPLLEPEYII